MEESKSPTLNSAEKNDTEVERQLELMKFLRDLSPGCKNLVVKYFVIKEERANPLLSEYLNVGLEFAALGVMIRREIDKKAGSDIKLRSNLPRVAMESVLRRAMSRLQLLAYKAQFMQEKAMEKSCSDRAVGKKVEEWQSEKGKLLQQLGEAKADVTEMKKRRAEDAKANAKVVAIFATQEHSWKIEKRKLVQEIDLSKKQMDILQRQLENRTPEGRLICKNCKKRDSFIVNLKEQLDEKELEVMATMEETKLEQIEKKELLNKLISTELVITSLRERLDKEMKEKQFDLQKQQEVVVELTLKQQGLEEELQESLEKLEASERMISETSRQKSICEGRIGKYSEELDAIREKMAGLMAEKSRQDAVIEESGQKFLKLRKAVAEKEELISELLNRTSAERDGRLELSKELAQIKIELTETHNQKERWKRTATEWNHINNNQKELVKPIHSLECRDAPEEDRLAEMLRFHQNRSTDLQQIYEKRIQELDKQIQTYQGNLSEKKNDMLLHITEHLCKFYDDNIGMIKDMGSSEIDSNDGVQRTSGSITEVDTTTRHLQLAKGSLSSNSMEIEHDLDMELGEWKKLYLSSKHAVEMLQKNNEESGALEENPSFENWVKLIKAKQASQLTEKHWHEIESFSKQMRARDERLEAFRFHLLKMDKELNERKFEAALLESELDRALQENLKLLTRLQERTKQLEECSGEVKLMEAESKAHPQSTCHQTKTEQRSVEFDVPTKSPQAKNSKFGKILVQDLAKKKSAASNLTEVKFVPIRRPKKLEIRLRDKAFAKRFVKQAILKNQLKDILILKQNDGIGEAQANPVTKEKSETCQPQKTFELVSSDEEKCRNSGSTKTDPLPPALSIISEDCSANEKNWLLRHEEQPQARTSLDSLVASLESESADNSPTFLGKDTKSRSESKATIWGFLSRLRPTDLNSDQTSTPTQSITSDDAKIEPPVMRTANADTRSKEKNDAYSMEHHNHLSEYVDVDGDAYHSSAAVNRSDKLTQQNGFVQDRATETVFKLAKNMQKIEKQLGFFEEELKLKVRSIKEDTEMQEGDASDVAELKLPPFLAIIPALRRQSRRYQALLGMTGRLCSRVNLNDSLELYSLPYSEAFPSILRLSLRETLNLEQLVNLAGQDLIKIQDQISGEDSIASEERQKIGNSIQNQIEIVIACFAEVQKGLEAKVLELITNFKEASAHEIRFQLCFRKSRLIRSSRRKQDSMTRWLPQN